MSLFLVLLLSGASFATSSKDLGSFELGRKSDTAGIYGGVADGYSFASFLHSDVFDISGGGRGGPEVILALFDAGFRPGKTDLFSDQKVSHFVARPEIVRVVPEPGSLALMGTGLIAVASRIRRKFRA